MSHYKKTVANTTDMSVACSPQQTKLSYTLHAGELGFMETNGNHTQM